MDRVSRSAEGLTFPALSICGDGLPGLPHPSTALHLRLPLLREAFSESRLYILEIRTYELPADFRGCVFYSYELSPGSYEWGSRSAGWVTFPYEKEAQPYRNKTRRGWRDVWRR